LRLKNLDWQESVALTNSGRKLSALVAAARQLGFECKAAAIDFTTLKLLRYPTVYLDGPIMGREFLMHAVIVESLAEEIVVLDPSMGRVRLARATFDAAWEQAGNYAVWIEQPKTAR
jgi:ABC-type bacteriocin/lantibiotic exporter with double-glycine peptidase domain